MNNKDLFLKLETELINKYKIFEGGATYVEIEKDYINVDCQRYFFNYLGRYLDWIINFIDKFMKLHKYKGFVYVFGYILKF